MTHSSVRWIPLLCPLPRYVNRSPEELTGQRPHHWQIQGWNLPTGAEFGAPPPPSCHLCPILTGLHGALSPRSPVSVPITRGLLIPTFSSMAKYFRNNFINPHIYSRGIAKLIFCWDFTVTHEKAVKLRQKNLSTEIRVSSPRLPCLCLAAPLCCSGTSLPSLKVIGSSWCLITALRLMLMTGIPGDAVGEMGLVT